MELERDIERDIMDFFGTQESIRYSQGFTIIYCVATSLLLSGEYFAVNKALQSSHSAIRWFDHNDLKSLEHVLLIVENVADRLRDDSLEPCRL